MGVIPMARTPLTKAQIEKIRAQRLEKAKELQEGIAARVEELVDSFAWQAMLDFASKFHAYSFNNLLLIQMQNPNASQVAGFRQWQKLGRQVRRGEKAIKIFGYGERKTNPKNTTETTGEGDTEQPVEEEVRPGVVRYYPIVNVFDISQTDPIEGAEQPPAVARLLTGEDTEGLYAQVLEFLQGRGWSVTRSMLEAGLNGYTETSGSRQVVISSRLEDAQAAKTLLHEAAHVLLHSEESYAEYVAHRGLKEVEAESVAYVVAGAFGMDTSPYTIGYVAGWSKTDVEVIKQSATNVLKAAHVLIEAISNQIDTEAAA